MKRLHKTVTSMLLVLAASAASAAQPLPATFSGNLDDSGNTALTGSFGEPPVFVNGDPLASTQNVALHAFNVASNQNVRFLSVGYAAGGIDPYVSLFAGTDASATFVRSFFGAVEGDFDEIAALAAGDYTVTIGLYSNMSFAENLGSGTLGDGFTGLGGSTFGNGYYELRLSGDGNGGGNVPEPSSAWLLLVGSFGVWLARRRGTPVA